MTIRSIRQMTMILLAGLVSISFYGCAPKQPKVDSAALASPSASSGLGSFNLQKRHGLGGWSKAAGPSEAELMRRMAVSQANLPASSQPTGKETR